MRRRKTSRYNFPKIQIPGIRLPKSDRPRFNLPQLNLPNIQLPKLNLPFRQLFVVAGLVVLVFAMINLNARLTDYSRLSSERDAVRVEVTQLQSTQDTSQTQLAYAGSTQAVEEYARNAHMVREGEMLVIAVTVEGNQLTTPEAPVSQNKPVRKWQVWWALFFGER